MRIARLLVATLWVASIFPQQGRADVAPLTDERSITATASGYVIAPTFEQRTDGPQTYTPPSAFESFGPVAVVAQVFNGDAFGTASQTSLISAQTSNVSFNLSGQATGNPFNVRQDATLVGSVSSFSRFRISFRLDANYDYSAVYNLDARFRYDTQGAPFPPDAANALEAGYRLIGPSGEVFSIVQHGQFFPASAISGTRSGSLSAGVYIFEAWASEAGSNYRGEGYTFLNANYFGSLRLTRGNAPCTLNTSIRNVGLPEVTISLPFPVKPWQIRYGGLAVDFQVTEVTGNGNCVAQSNSGSFTVSARPFVTGSEPFALFASSRAAATVRTFQPGEGVASQGDYLINGPFVASAYYLQWRTAWFTTELSSSPPQSLFPGPVTAWLNLDAAGLSPQSHNFEEVVRGAEPIIHQGLMNAFPLVATYTVFQDLGRVSLLVVNQQSLATGIQSDGSLITALPLSFYYPSAANPAAVLLNTPTGTFRIIVTGIEAGGFTLAAATEDMAAHLVKEKTASGTISPGSSLAFDATIIAGSPPEIILQAKPIASLTLEINFLTGSDIDKGIKNSLLVKLEHAREHLSTGQKSVANELNAFINEVQAMPGKKLAPDIKAKLIGWTADVMRQLSSD